MDIDRETAIITESLTLCAERLGDIVPLVFEKFFAADGGAASLMAHSDAHMQGRMFESTLDLLMTSDHFGPGKYLDWELDNHLSYDASPAMYLAYLNVVQEIVMGAADDAWTEETGQAWNNRKQRIMRQVEDKLGS